MSINGKKVDIDFSKFKISNDSDLSKIEVKIKSLKSIDTSVNFRSKINRAKSRMNTSKTNETKSITELDLLKDVTLDCVNQLKEGIFNPFVLLMDHNKKEITYITNVRKGIQEFIDDTDVLLMKKKPDAAILPVILINNEDKEDLLIILVSKLCGVVISIIEIRKGFLGFKYNGPYYTDKIPSFIFPKFSKFCENQKEVNIWKESVVIKNYNKKIIKEDIENYLIKYYRGEE